jgi:hypothetical protein
VKRAIDGGFDFIIDETLRTQESREKWIKLIHAYCCQTFKSYKIVLTAFPEIDIETSLRNRMKNPKGVPKEKWKEIITRMASNWETLYHGTYTYDRYKPFIDIDIARFESIYPFNKTADYLLNS